MKHFLPALLSPFFAAALTSCGSDDDNSLQYQYYSLNLRTNETSSLPAGSSGGTSSNTFVVSIDHSGNILPHHVGTATVEAIGNRTQYTYTIQVTPVKKLFTDLGDCVNRSRSEIERILGAPTSSTGYKYFYPSPLLEQEIQVRYNKDYVMDYAIQTFEKLYSSKITEQIDEYYAFYKVDDNQYSIYINANTFDEATVLLVRNQTAESDRILYMTPNMYLLVGDIGNIFS